MKKKDNTEKETVGEQDIEETALPFVRKFVTRKPRVTEGARWARLEVEGVPHTVDEVDSLTPRQKAGLITLAVRNILQHGGSQYVRGLLSSNKPLASGETVKVDFAKMIDLKDTAKAKKEAKEAILNEIIQDMARAALAGNKAEVEKLQKLHLDMTQG